jgi:hypothetical protein
MKLNELILFAFEYKHHLFTYLFLLKIPIGFILFFCASLLDPLYQTVF